jgi:nicotinate-nucleotide pyrophosphorylase (carboxylating)
LEQDIQVYLSDMLSEYIRNFIEMSLKEDVGAGDVTSESSVPKDLIEKGYILAKEEGVVAGIEVAKEVFFQVNEELEFIAHKSDGDKVVFGDVVIEVKGSARSILMGERLALNFMQRMSGIATRTFDVTQRLMGTPTKVLDTRKTTPGFRAFEKLAVTIGGGVNHRMGLYDMILIKDNHVDYAGGMSQVLAKVSEYLCARPDDSPLLKVVVETRSFEEIERVLEAREASDIEIERVLLDNFSHSEVNEAVRRYSSKITLEASGGITPDNVRGYGDAGVDFVSMGYMTHSVKSLDFSLKSTPHVS